MEVPLRIQLNVTYEIVALKYVYVSDGGVDDDCDDEDDGNGNDDVCKPKLLVIKYL